MNKSFLISILFLIFISCQKETIVDTYTGTYIESGSAIVVNEGTFLTNNSSASFISRNGVVTNNIYALANNGANCG